jgi:electron transfer flavoprotein alpha subunit
MWASALIEELLGEDLVILPASPDGRDLAPRLAAALERPLFAGAIEVRDHSVICAGHHSLVTVEHIRSGPALATFQPGVRGVEPTNDPLPTPTAIDPIAGSTPPGFSDAEIIEVLPPDVATMDLAEAPRIIGGGNGLESEQRFRQLARIADALNASVGTTRVITDKGWLPHERQIGTTGVVVDPDLYLAFGISGAVQHTSGLGQPDHVISVNTESHCPMMDLASLAIVSDANATLDELERLLQPTDESGSGQ